MVLVRNHKFVVSRESQKERSDKRRTGMPTVELVADDYGVEQTLV